MLPGDLGRNTKNPSRETRGQVMWAPACKCFIVQTRSRESACLVVRMVSTAKTKRKQNKKAKTKRSRFPQTKERRPRIPASERPTAETDTQQTGCRESDKRAAPSQPSRTIENFSPGGARTRTQGNKNTNRKNSLLVYQVYFNTS